MNPQLRKPPAHVALPEAARRLGQDYFRLRRRLLRGEIASWRRGWRWYIPIREVERLERDGVERRVTAGAQEDGDH